VILSANVFVAPLRAIALARAASDRVLVRASRREPVFARALVRAAHDASVTLVDAIDVESIEEGEIHVYGRDETIASVRKAARTGVVVRGHGAGLGVAIVSARSPLDVAAGALADDVVPFDQRGCLSPRVVLTEGDEARARSFVAALDTALAERAREVPRGPLASDERADARRWTDAMAYAGTLFASEDHAVAVAPPRSALVVPPAGRHVHVAPAHDIDSMRTLLAPIAPWTVCIGCDAPSLAAAVAPAHARLTPLGRMQRPPLDGSVDKRVG
jgi:hypothetical protein